MNINADKASIKERQMENRIFISYRRDDTLAAAGRISDSLRFVFGDEALFLDIDNIPAASVFPTYIDKQLANCNIVLAVIGKRWLSTGMSKVAGWRRSRRIDDPKDMVRIEISTALRRAIPVLPVLIDGAVMPSEDELPDDLRGLARRQAIEVRNTYFGADIKRLTAAICKAVPNFATAQKYTSLNHAKQIGYSEAEMEQYLIDFSAGANDLLILAGSGGFLKSNTQQFAQISKFGKHCRMLVNDRHSVALADIQQLLDSGVQIRVYEEQQNTIFRGRVKFTSTGGSLCAFDRANNHYKLLESSNSLLVDLLRNRFDEWFEGARHPLIKNILIDFGNVYLLGDYGDFIVEASRIAGIKLNLRSSDYLCANDDLNTGKIDIVQYVERMTNKELDELVREKIKVLWSNNWTLNPDMYQLAQELKRSNYILSVVSNCDRGNADVYELKNYFDVFSQRFLSCRLGILKPTQEYFGVVIEKLKCAAAECVIIDDHLDVIESARGIGMDAIHVSRALLPEERAPYVRRELLARGIK